MRHLGILPIFLLLPLIAYGFQDVVNTPHNLSISGPGNVKSGTIDKVCVFCHTPHGAEPSIPLWNHQLPSGQIYTIYDSTTMQATIGQPTGKSLLCLGCHDGTVALGLLVNPPTGQSMDLDNRFLSGRSMLNTDLADDHPISFVYDSALATADGELANPSNIGLPLEFDQLQCTTCHDPHEKDLLPFLRKSTVNGEICTTCHLPGLKFSGDWAASSHATSTSVWNSGSGPDPWSERKPQWKGNNVAENACFNCHTPHNAATIHGLAKAQEENTCFLCHNGSVASTDLQAEFLKLYRHSVTTYSGVHEPTEDFTANPIDHVECQDCHNPHLSNDIAASAPNVPGSMLGVKAINSSATQIAEAANLYEICYKCHADNNIGSVNPVVSRQNVQKNTRLEFDLGNPSYHPIEGVGQNPNVPSLLSPYSENSIIYCTDCHNNDAVGLAPRGPHGSIYRPILERNYTTADFTVETALEYDLCYKCHDRNSILSDESFSEHSKHIQKENTPCSACHDPHGISSNQGNATNNSHLINFDSNIVSPPMMGMGGGDLRFEDLGTFRGRCYLRCHGKNHNPETYP